MIVGLRPIWRSSKGVYPLTYGAAVYYDLTSHLTLAATASRSQHDVSFPLDRFGQIKGTYDATTARAGLIYSFK